MHTLSGLIKKNKRFADVFGKYKMAVTDEYYNHHTFGITGLSDYIEILYGLNTVNGNGKSPNRLVFRGHPEAGWKLVPSLARYKADYRKSYSPEHDMVMELHAEFPEVFHGKSSFETLATVQHYGIPTRLLDFTYSPLIALYFACCDSPLKEGRVVFGSSPIEYFNSPIVEAICGMYKISMCDNYPLDYLLEGHDVNAADYLRQVYDWFGELNPIFAAPPYLNDRIKRQQGIFMIFPNEVEDGCASNLIFDHKDGLYYREELLKKEDMAEIYQEVLRQPQYIMFQQPMLNLSYDSVKRLFDCYKREDGIGFDVDVIEKICKKRFILKDEIMTMDECCLQSNFGSVVISAKHKKKILEELEALGIDKAYVYPEIEYTAGKIKRKMLG